MSNRKLVIMRAVPENKEDYIIDINQQQKENEQNEIVYSYLVLFLILMCRIVV